MILREELIRIARLNRLTPYQQEKHYIQIQILRSIYSHTTRELVFKGGSALWITYRLNRFSEDMDFTLSGRVDLQRLSSMVKRDLELLGIRSRIRILKDDRYTYTFRIGAEGPLYTREIERCYVRVEVSRREHPLMEPRIINIDTVYPDTPIFQVVVMSLEEMLAEKVRAIFTRMYARDVYDLWYMVERLKVMPRLKLIASKLSTYGLRFSMEAFEGKVEEKRDIWTDELRPLVIGRVPPFEEAKSSILSAFRGMLALEHG